MHLDEDFKFIFNFIANLVGLSQVRLADLTLVANLSAVRTIIPTVTQFAISTAPTCYFHETEHNCLNHKVMSSVDPQGEDKELPKAAQTNCQPQM